MNSCRFRQAIDDYLLQRLGEEEKAGFEEHFFNCRDCFEELKAREEILRVIKARGGEIFTGGAEPAGEAIEPGRRAALRFKPWWGRPRSDPVSPPAPSALPRLHSRPG